MTPSSTPGTSSSWDDHGDPVPWADTDPHGSADATRPLPAVSRLPAAPAAGDEDWSWYDTDDDAQHTRPLPPVAAQRSRGEDLHPRTDPTPTAPLAPPAPAPMPPLSSAPPVSRERAVPADHGMPAHGTPGYGVQGYGVQGHGTPGYGVQGYGATGAGPVPGLPVDPATRYARQREEFGGLQLVPGFFGWLSALALTWLLLALAGLAASAAGLRLDDGMGGVVDELASGSPAAWTGAVVLGAAEFLAFLGGGYAAGRMARFSGARQGVSVWLWSLLGRSVATVAGLVWADTIGLAPVGVSAQALIGDLLAPGLLAVAAVLLVDLLGAVLGGLWGARYHRRVDRWGDTGR
ncbi:hypothetical protein [Kocuria rosea]|uniref:hypothetical protein n=1 Tax=Kocuria rosea TaxID=1275 RepID=UPI00203F561F|nr:hypothetical protein [Kocuria rosea]MCM3686453.1 hypothetical protein [Kocuria rosea]